MKKNFLYCLFLILAVFVTSCELPDNSDPKSATKVEPEAIFIQAQVALTTQIGSINVNQNISRLLVQYQSEVTYVTESRYNFSDRQIPDNFSGNIYRGALLNLKEMKRILDEYEPPTPADEGRTINQLAIGEIWAVYAYHALVDAFGDIPYTEALLGAENSRPVYDDGQAVYLDLIDRLNDAIDALDDGFDGFGAADLIYGGDIALWRKFAATLKFRMGMRLADVTGVNVNTIITEALSTGVFEDLTEGAIWVPYGIAPYVSPYYQEFFLNARKDFCPTNTLVTMMNTLNDPRREVWFTQYPAGSGAYLGLPYGKAGASNYKSFSHFVDAILLEPDYPTILSDYVEVEFLLAEAAERSLGGLVPADAEGHYNNAILASMEYWGVSDVAAATYLARADVAYTTAAGNWKQKIGTQKWLGLFDRGVEAWAEWRRLDYPILNAPQDMAQADIPLRMPYPYNENKQNKDNYDAAAAAIGGDEATTPLFWDTFNPTQTK